MKTLILGIGNFLTFGDFPARGMSDPASYLIPRGVNGEELVQVKVI